MPPRHSGIACRRTARVNLWALLAAPAIVAAAGCGTTREYQATEQLVLSDAVDRSVSTIDFRPLAGRHVYLDTTYLVAVKANTFVNAEYVISSLRQQILAAGCYLEPVLENAELVIEPRIGTLGADNHRVTYGIPENNLLSGAANFVPGAPQIGGVPEIAFARRESREGAAKVAAFAYDRVTRQAVWQSGISQSTANAKDTWILGVGPFQKGSIRNGTKFAGSTLIEYGDSEVAQPVDESFDRPPVDYTSEVRFDNGFPLLDDNEPGEGMLGGGATPGPVQQAGAVEPVGPQDR